MVIPWLAAKYPKLLKNSYESLFFDASLSFAEKVARWRTQPMTSLQLLANVMLRRCWGWRCERGVIAMTAITTPKSAQANRLEGFVLTALFQGFPTFAAAALVLKITGSHEIVGTRYGAAFFVVLASLFFGLIMPSLGGKFPYRFKHAYEPLFFDASLLLEKIARWRAQPVTSLQLVTKYVAVAAGGGGRERGVGYLIVIPGRRVSGEPEIHNHDREYRIRTAASRLPKRQLDD